MKNTISINEKAWDKDYSKRKGLWKGITNYEFDFPEKSKVLEVGCGNGKTLLALTNKKLEIYGIDYSEKAIELCKEIIPKNEHIILEKISIVKTNFPDEFFENIICFHILGHLIETERQDAIKEILRILKPEGKIYFREFGLKDFRCGMKGIEIEPKTFRRHTGIITHYFTKEEVENLFKKCKVEWFFEDNWKVKYAGLRDRQEINFVFKK